MLSRLGPLLPSHLFGPGYGHFKPSLTKEVGVGWFLSLKSPESQG